MKEGGGGKFIREHWLARCSFPDGAGDRPLWLHCASVGEARVGAALARNIAAHRDWPVLFTVNTPTAARLLQEEGVEKNRICYRPFDFAANARRFVHSLRPRAAIFIEGEIWPNLWNELARRGVPLIVANARMTDRTARMPGLLRPLWARLLAGAHVLCRSRADCERFSSFSPCRGLEVAGNLKAAMMPPAADASCPDPTGRPFLLALSTHRGEELMLARAVAALPSPPLLVVAPRYPYRSDSLLLSLRARLRAGRRIQLSSHHARPSADATVYIIDRIGGLAPFLTHAMAVFVGGSLTGRRRGHNVLEPASYGRAVVVGPHTENFVEEVELLRRHNALEIAGDVSALTACLPAVAGRWAAAVRLWRAGAERRDAGGRVDQRKLYRPHPLDHRPGGVSSGGSQPSRLTALRAWAVSMTSCTRRMRAPRR